VPKSAIDARVNIVTELVIRGFSLAKVKELLEQNAKAKGTPQFRPELEWGVQERAIRDYYKRATEAVSKLGNMSIEMELALAKSRYEDLYQRAVQKQAYGVAARVLRDKTELLTLRSFVQVATTPPPTDNGSTETPSEHTAQVRLGDGTVIDL
jgi:hypothetical protein